MTADVNNNEQTSVLQTAAPESAPVSNALTRNDFHILGVGVRDTSAAIADAAADRLLSGDPAAVEKARANLTNPRARLTSEVAWLPGVAPSRAAELVSETLRRPGLSQVSQLLPATARANLLYANLESLVPPSEGSKILRILRYAAAFADQIDPNESLRELNEDRLVAGVPPIRSLQLVVDAVDEHRRYFKEALHQFLNRLPTNRLVEVLTAAASQSSSLSNLSGSETLERVIDGYELEIRPFLDTEAENVRRLCATILANASKGEAHVAGGIGRLADLVRNWNIVAKPVQLSAIARGRYHEETRSIAVDIRSLGVDLHNKFSLTGTSERLVELCKASFQGIPDFEDKLIEDAEAIRNLKSEFESTAAARDSFEREVTYRAHIGFSKTLLSIDSREIVWGTTRFPVESITRVRWGGTQHSINGIPTGSTFTILFGTAAAVSVVSTRSSEVYEAFTTRLWKVVGHRLIVDTLNRLNAGETMQWGNIKFDDIGVFIRRTKSFGKSKIRKIAWPDVRVWSSAGRFYIQNMNDSKVVVSSSYLETDNMHILEAAVRMTFNNGAARLSDLLST